jgi:phosphoglycerate dehydrogenase-like enzyme
MQVLAYTSRPRDTPESRRLQSGYTVPGTGDPDGLIPASWHHGNVDDMLSLGLDLVVLAVPLTDATRGLLGRRQFGVMRDSGKRAFIANVARGPVVDTDALIDALETGAIAGAALDVTDPEPLPEGHPLWTAPNVFITPHVSWQSTNMFTHVCAILKENLRRLDQGEELINLIDKPKS